MPKMRTSIKIRAGYRPATSQKDGNKRCQHCSRKTEGGKMGKHGTPVLSCKLLGTAINPDYTCREYKLEEN